MRSLVCVCVLSRGPAVFFRVCACACGSGRREGRKKHLGRRARCLWQRGIHIYIMTII